MPAKDKIVEIFCIADDFCKECDMEIKNTELCPMTAKSSAIAPVRCPGVSG